MRRTAAVITATVAIVFGLALLTDTLFAQSNDCPDRAVDTGVNASKTPCASAPLIICSSQGQQQCSGTGTTRPGDKITSTMQNDDTKVENEYKFCYRLTVCNWEGWPVNKCKAVSGGSNVDTPQPTTIPCPAGT